MPRCSRDTEGDPYIAPGSRRFNKHKNLAFYCERTNEISPSSVEISRRRKHLYEYSICRNNFGNARRATYRAPFSTGGRSSPMEERWSRVALCQWDQTWTWAKLRETLFRQPSDPDSPRGRSVQEQPSDSETDFPAYKIHTGGRSWDQL